jgi:hypothetical protein
MDNYRKTFFKYLFQIEWNSTTKSLEKPTEIAGFYLSAGVRKTVSTYERHD